MKTVTVFTPTYNRAYIIEKLYLSLKRQTVKDFEWLVVDDGSNDETEQLFTIWAKQEKDFSIRYYKQENGGKCRAINHALELAEGKLFFTVDSDDYLTDDAIEKVTCWERALPKDVAFCGVAGNLGTSETETVNSLFDGEYYDGTLLDRYKIVDGERAHVFYTAIHRKYPYPVFEGEKFMTEAVVWNRMANDGYQMRFYNDIIWVYEYKDDGITKAGSKMFINNPNGYGLWLKEKAYCEGVGIVVRLKMYYTFLCDLEKQYSIEQISKFIGAPMFLMCVFNRLHKMLSWIKRRIVE